jgi:hypothetical protein
MAINRHNCFDMSESTSGVFISNVNYSLYIIGSFLL